MIIKVLDSILRSLYQYTSTAICFSILFMVTVLYVKKYGIHTVCKEWINEFKTNRIFRLELYFTFYTMMVLLRTFFCRPIYYHPLSNLLGNWGMRDENGNLYTENIENIILFIPWTYLFGTIKYSKDKMSLVSLKSALQITLVSFAFTLAIEFSQLFFKVGTFQLSDLFFNVLGGTIGAFLRYITWKFRRRK